MSDYRPLLDQAILNSLVSEGLARRALAVHRTGRRAHAGIVP